MLALRASRRLQGLAGLAGAATLPCIDVAGSSAAQQHVLAAGWQATQAAAFAKAPAKQKGKKGGHEPPAAAGAAEAGALAIDLDAPKSHMERAVDHLHHELANLRSGRATPGMLDHLRVDVYGERLPLKAVGTASVRDPQLLVVTLFDPATVDAVVKGIQDSPLQLSARAEGQEVLVPVPRPTAETLAAMAKVCRQEGETAKVAVRHARKLSMDAVKGLASEDERKRVEKEVQRLTDDFIAQVERAVAEKERQLRDHSS